jgi:putative heme-binding domain-containing protein
LIALFCADSVYFTANFFVHRNRTMTSFLKQIAVTTFAILIAGFTSIPTLALDHDHNHGTQEQEIKRPKIFLDKNPRVVKFQLKRLDNAQLLLVERKDDDKKYLLVHEEVLTRDGMSKGDRSSALDAIAKIKGTDSVSELLALIPSFDEKQSSEKRIARQLASLLLDQSSEVLKAQVDGLKSAAEAKHGSLSLAGFSGLIKAGESKLAEELGKKSNQATANLLKSIPLIPNKKLRNSLHAMVLDSAVSGKSENIQSSAISALGSLDKDKATDFKKLSPLVSNQKLRRSVVKTLLGVPRGKRDVESAGNLAEYLVKHAEDTSADARTSNEFLEAMQLADQVLTLIPKDTANDYRKRLDEVTVRVVLLHAVEEEMRYDKPWFAVEAGRDIQIVLVNEDLMAHNLVVTVPEALQEIALDGAALGPKIGESGKQYVPKSEKVLAATDMIQAEKQGRITFTAPTEPGEYPYVCTFPGHWMRMYGVMVVVNDLAEFQRNPIEPKDPVGSNRPFVKEWTVDDLKDKLAAGLRGRTNKIGKKIFTEATCAQCHQVGDEGKAVGPALTDVWSRWKGDGSAILQEVLDPSHRIEPKYIVRKIVTADGEVISGIVVEETKDTISILPNPESKVPTVVNQEDIEDMVKSSVSIMPKKLMDRFTEDEIFELMAYLKNADPGK